MSRGTSTVDAPAMERSAAARGWDYARYVVILMTLGLAVAVVLTGDAPGTWSDLRPEYQDQDLAGWRVPPLVKLGWFLAWVLSIWLLAAAPRTWRATPAAWCWMLLLVPVCMPLFLLLAGPTPGIPAPRAPGRRVTGGWSFLICLALAAASGRFG